MDVVFSPSLCGDCEKFKRQDIGLSGNSEPELSQKLAHYLLSAEAQSKALDFGNIIPSNQQAKAGNEAAQAKLDAFQGYMKTANTLDWDAVNEKRQEWNSRWNRTIER